MSAPQLTLQSITGVDVELRIAGPGSRSYAFVVDLHIRALVAFAYWMVASFIYFGSFQLIPGDEASESGSYEFVVAIPALAIYLLYHPVLEVLMHGRTPGKRIAGVRIVTRQGDIPGVGALLLRNVFRLVDSLPMVYLIGLCVVVFTSQHVRIGDLAAGTLLVLDSSDTDASLTVLGAAGGGRLDPRTADLVHEFLDRWKELDYDTRRNLGRTLLARVEPELTTSQILEFNDDTLRARLAAALAPTAS